ncbi:MAG: hypothetical protein ABR597_10785 [Bacteroidales bacterium]
MKKQTALIVLLVLALMQLNVGCNQGQRQEATDLLHDTIGAEGLKMSEAMVNEIISSVPNPVEMASALQKNDVVYSQKLLNPSGNIDNYNTNFQRALNLGIYGTDLIYMNIYDRTVATLRYLTNIRELAADLRLEQFFDYNTLNRLSESSKNVDSVLFITNTGFDKMTRYLIDQDRSNIAVLISAGTWIESLYIATHAPKTPENQELLNKRIGEQKKVLDNLILLMNAYEQNEGFNTLLQDLKDLKSEFDRVTISYVYAEPSVKEQDGSLIVVDNSRSMVEINDETVKRITEAVANIRNKIIE